MHVVTEEVAELAGTSLSAVHTICIQTIQAIDDHVGIERNSSCTSIVTIALWWVELVLVVA